MEAVTLTFPLQCSFKRQQKSRNSSSLSLFLGKYFFAISNKISPLSDLKRNLNNDFCTIVQIIKKASSIPSHHVLFYNKEVLSWHQKNPQYLTFPLKYLQQVTQPGHKSWALTDFSHLPFSVNEQKQPLSEEDPMQLNFTNSDFVSADSHKAVCATQTLSVINISSGFGYWHKQPPTKP